MKKPKLILMLLAGMFVATSCKDDDDENVVAVPEADKTFVNKAADGGMFEVRAGEMAAARGDSTLGMVMGLDSMSIRSFGQMMVTDHTKANNELKTLADQKGVDVPTTLSASKQAMLDSLTGASGAAFNMMYARMMVSSHQETVSLFETQADNGQDNELKTWASQMLPTLRHHLEMAEMMHDEMQ
jgi:putative membrane protein